MLNLPTLVNEAMDLSLLILRLKKYIDQVLHFYKTFEKLLM